MTPSLVTATRAALTCPICGSMSQTTPEAAAKLTDPLSPIAAVCPLDMCVLELVA